MQRLFVIYVRMFSSNKLEAGMFPAVKTGENEFSSSSLARDDSFGRLKIVYYETRKTKRQAMLRVKELNELNKRKLFLMIKVQNPEMLDLSGLFRQSKRIGEESNGNQY
jgi:predicted GIY-YIG superfamily endonuclease